MLGTIVTKYFNVIKIRDEKKKNWTYDIYVKKTLINKGKHNIIRVKKFH